MASHPYISGPGNVTQMIGFLRKNFPSTVTADTVKKLGIASNNESYVINVLQFLNLIDEQGKRTEEGHAVMSKHDEVEFQTAFATIVRSAYSDLFDLKAEDAWTMNRDQLISYFRSADKTSAIIGGRQAGVFISLRELAGHRTDGRANGNPKVAKAAKVATKPAKPARVSKPDVVVQDASSPLIKQQKGDVALTVRIEINLPADGTEETYDAIFKSIRANLFL